MKSSISLLLALGVVACGTVRPVTGVDSTKVEVRTETVIEKDTVYVELPRVVERVAVQDTTSHLENEFALSDAHISGGVLKHSLETKPVKMPAVVDKQIVYRDSIVFRERVQTQTVEVEKKLTGWQQAKLRVGGFCFFAVILIGLCFIITFLLNLKRF